MKVNLQEGERTLYKDYPQKAILVLWFFRSLAIALFIPFFIVPFILMVNRSFMDNYLLTYLMIFIPILIIVFAYHIALRRSYTFYITNERVILEGGILLRKIKSVPYHKITDVSIVQNIIERMLGISSLHVHTAGTGYQFPEIKFFSLANPEQSQFIIVKELKAFKADRSQSAAYNE